MAALVPVLHVGVALAWAQNHLYPESLHKTGQY